jgi:hypothetical protein
MDPQEKMLRELLSLTRDNHDMLRAINSQRRMSNFFFFIKWIIIIGLVYGAYVASQPYFKTFTNTVESINQFNQAPKESIQNILLNKVLGQ